jgi:hypothetical protein
MGKRNFTPSNEELTIKHVEKWGLKYTRIEGGNFHIKIRFIHQNFGLQRQMFAKTFYEIYETRNKF